jgi:arginase
VSYLKNRVVLTPFFLDESLPELKSLAKPDWIINNPTVSDGKKQTRISAIHKPLAGFVSEVIATDARPVSIAGDCCTAIGVLAGLQYAGINPSLIWFDAHGDFNTWETTPSGFLGGMPLAMIVGKGDQSMPEAVHLSALPENQVILTDARDLDPGERESLNESSIVHLAHAEALLEHPLPAGPIYVHFDTDVVSLQESPAHNYPAHGGPASAVLQSVFSRLSQTSRVIAASISTWNPKLDKNKKSENISMSLLQTLVGSF